MKQMFKTENNLENVNHDIVKTHLTIATT